MPESFANRSPLPSWDDHRTTEDPYPFKSNCFPQPVRLSYYRVTLAPSIRIRTYLMKLFRLPWKRRQAETGLDQEPELETTTSARNGSRPCLSCNRPFDPTRKTNLYCRCCNTQASRMRRTLNFLVKYQDHVCVGCGHTLPRHLFTVDHIVPKSTLGKSDASNLHALCFYCNSIKRDRTLDWLWQKNAEAGILTSDRTTVVKTLFNNAENSRFFDWVDEQDFQNNDPSRFDHPLDLMDDFMGHVETQRGKATYDKAID